MRAAQHWQPGPLRVSAGRVIPGNVHGRFNITQLGDAPDKIGKDTNFRGLTVSTTSSTSPRAAAATG
jgi:hypothetical protein